MCVCNLSYPARDSRAPYCVVMYGLFGYTTFVHIISLNGEIFGGKKFIQHKTVFWFSLQCLSETFFILRRTDLLRNVDQQNVLFKIML